MILMGVFSMVLVFGMPYLMENSEFAGPSQHGLVRMAENEELMVV